MSHVKNACNALSLLLVVSLSMAASAQLPDGDGDGIADNVDNCLTVANANQRDTDADGIGNMCDGDFNDDCIVNPADLAIFRNAFFSTDPDADLDGNGIVNPGDLAIFRGLFFAPPGPTGGQNLCTCTPPPVVPQADPNFEFNGQEVFLVGTLAGGGAAVPGLNNFSDQDNGLYLARIFARGAGTFDYRVADQSMAIDYCNDATLALYESLDLPAAGCAATGMLDLPGAGCYEFVMETGGTLTPDSVELSVADRLGRWDLTVDPAGGQVVAPNGVTLDVPPGAVAASTTVTIGDVSCAQVDTLFGATTLNSHDNRCLGAFAGEPTGLAFALPVDVTVPVVTRDADEIVLWVQNDLGRRDYTTLATDLDYDNDAATVSASIDELALFAAAGATNINNPLLRGGGPLPPCCDVTPTPLGCCCTTFSATSTAGDAFNSDCDCQLVGFDIEVTFPNCPGSPVFTDRESHSSENCPTDLTPTLDLPDLTQWTCETRTASVSLGGTNQDGTTCNMDIPLSWSAADQNIAEVVGSPIGTSATIRGIAPGGMTTLNAVSSVGNQFSFSAPLTVVDLSGPWFATESGSQTCVVDGNSETVMDEESGIVQVSVDNCATVNIDIGVPDLDGSSGPLTTTGDLLMPFTFDLDATMSSNTLACFVFFVTAGQDVDFGEPFCPSGAVCEPISCTETVTSDGVLNAAAFGSGASAADWTLNVAWSETIDGMTEMKSASCTGDSTTTFFKQ